jgi:alpha-1,6-mannosyltransferase
MAPWPFGPALVGLAGLVAVVIGAALPASPFTTKFPGAWIFGVPAHGTHPGGQWLTLFLVYGGIALLLAAWLALVAQTARFHFTLRHLYWTLALWCLPLLVAPPLLSRDAYTYGAEGQLVRSGLNPYTSTLAAHRSSVFYALSDPRWHHAHAPYGPLFFDLARLNAWLMGRDVFSTLEGYRVLALIGLVLMAGAVPRLARACGQSEWRALTLGVLNPLVLLYLVGGMHNDALMLGLLLVGLALALHRHPLLGIACCALAAEVKVPAALGLVFIGWLWAGGGASVPRRLGHTAGAVGLGGALMGVVSLLSGYGWGWVTNLSTPGSVVSWLDPATAGGLALSHLLHALGLHTTTHTLVSGARDGALALAALIVLALLWRTDRIGLPRALGWSLLAVVLLGPIVWPWYETWGLAALAIADDRWSQRWVLAVSAIACFATIPSGIALSSHGALALTGGLVVLAGVIATVLWRSDVLRNCWR